LNNYKLRNNSIETISTIFSKTFLNFIKNLSNLFANRMLFSGAGGPSDWMLRRWDPFDLDWNVWRQFEMMDRTIDRTFSRFENEMNQTRQ
jgi:hypothetical protein